MSFHVGQKVVCVDARPVRANIKKVSKDTIYTIRECGPEPFADGHWVLLDEIINRPSHWMGGFEECGYAASRFRPIVSRKTDIAIFKRMLLPQGVDA